MSDEKGRTVISLEDLLAQADLLKRQIDELQKLQAELLDSLSAIKSAKDALEELKNPQKEMYLSGDKRNFLMLKTSQVSIDKVLVYLGLSYYAEVTPDVAVKILSERENELNASLQEVNKRLTESANAYAQIAEILNSIQAQQQKGG
ncbi:MAG: prefoldin subunit alpha [Candidatus Aramenus sp.]|nr:prefoldin subunit alpha [Candidatus Aramenus sp.]